MAIKINYIGGIILNFIFAVSALEY